ncbi:MAG TPA: hypothetical protein VK995_06375 [Oceanipulchritudo sp.]|nr:hypothetical protein [Oceanipulchritudo sp.]
MKMQERKPRESRFEDDTHEARLLRLREGAPTLASNRRLQLYAIFGSILMLITVLGFYVAMQIYKAVSEDREKAILIEVDQAPEVEESETEKALKRAEEEEAAEAAALEAQLEQLKEVDLVEELGKPAAGN